MKRNVFWILLVLFIIAVTYGYSYYQSIFAPNVTVSEDQSGEFFIKRGSTYDQVANNLLEEKLIKDPKGFDWVAQRMNYPKHVYPGRYVLQNGMSNRELLQMLRSGHQSPIKYTFIKYRTVPDLVEDVAAKFEMSEVQLLDAINDQNLMGEYGLKPETLLGIFIPNTYELYWTTSAKDFIKRMYKEYRSFWGDARNNRAEQMRLKRMEIMALASIVEEETNKNTEKARIAGVYLNRVRKRMLLQADPTVKFAVGDFSIRRVLNKHLEVDSPFNTYKYPGIPPGPICTPSIPSIDAVLNSERHDYLYFCARPDSSGMHQFSKTLTEHLNYARAYHASLNQRGIR